MISSLNIITPLQYLKYQHKQGFTLFELLVVLMILSLAAAMVIPQISSGEINVLRGQMRDAVATLNYARRLAIVTGTTQKVVCEQQTATENEQIIPDEKNTSPTRSDNTPIIYWRSRERVSLARKQVFLEPDQDQKSLANPETDESTGFSFSFYPEGGSNGGVLILTYLNYKAKVTVHPLTGKVESEIVNGELMN